VVDSTEEFLTFKVHRVVVMSCTVQVSYAEERKLITQCTESQ
jgi:hypothetical protein